LISDSSVELLEALGIKVPTAEESAATALKEDVDLKRRLTEAATTTNERVMLKLDDESRSHLLSWVRSLTLADHIGDVANDVDRLLKDLGVNVEWDELSELDTELGKLGVNYRHEAASKPDLR
jgi:hypothetical protein